MAKRILWRAFVTLRTRKCAEFADRFEDAFVSAEAKFFMSPEELQTLVSMVGDDQITVVEGCKPLYTGPAARCPKSLWSERRRTA